MEAEVEYTAVVSVKVDLETGDVASVDIWTPGDEDDVPVGVSVGSDSNTNQPDEVFDPAQHLVDATAPSSCEAGELRHRRSDGDRSSAGRTTRMTPRRTLR